MDKIKVSKEVAHALEMALKTCSKAKFFEQHSNKMQWSLDVYLPLNQISNWKMAQILINGYEVEETPEDKLIRQFRDFGERKNNFTTESKNFGYWEGREKQVVATLNTLGIKIKGINE